MKQKGTFILNRLNNWNENDNNSLKIMIVYTV